YLPQPLLPGLPARGAAHVLAGWARLVGGQLAAASTPGPTGPPLLALVAALSDRRRLQLRGACEAQPRLAVGRAAVVHLAHVPLPATAAWPLLRVERGALAHELGRLPVRLQRRLPVAVAEDAALRLRRRRCFPHANVDPVPDRHVPLHHAGVRAGVL